MDTDLAPVDLALHWPFIRSHLLLERWPAAGRALDALAVQQLDALGNPVRFGTKFWRAAGLTDGQIGSTTDALLELERRRVVARYPGRGRLGHSWTFVPSIRHWRSMPWSGTGRSVEITVRGCACRGPCPVVAVVPGQGVALSRTWGVFRLSAADHLQRPGLLPVDDRDYGARSATTGQRPRLSLVDDRDYGAAEGANPGSPSSLPELFKLIKRSQRFYELVEAFDLQSEEPLWIGSKYYLELMKLWIRLDHVEAQEEALIAEFRRHPGKVHRGNVVDVVADLSTAASVKGANRPVGTRSQHPSLMDLSRFAPEPVA
jgi:hypothetical protein